MSNGIYATHVSQVTFFKKCNEFWKNPWIGSEQQIQILELGQSWNSSKSQELLQVHRAFRA